jgi:hypothetical protein
MAKAVSEVQSAAGPPALTGAAVSSDSAGAAAAPPATHVQPDQKLPAAFSQNYGAMRWIFGPLSPDGPRLSILRLMEIITGRRPNGHSLLCPNALSAG